MKIDVERFVKDYKSALEQELSANIQQSSVPFDQLAKAMREFEMLSDNALAYAIGRGILEDITK